MGKFSGVLICTDLDGTLLRKDKTVSDENLNAIEYFKSEGGTVTFVTGRMPFIVSSFYDTVKPNAPFGCINGGGLYDRLKEDYIWKSALSDNVSELIKCVDEKIPDMGILVNTFYNTYYCKDNETTVKSRRRTGLPNLHCRYDEVEEPMSKIAFASEKEEELLRAEEILAAHPLAHEFAFFHSERTLFEILPKGINKGTAIRKLTELLGLDINKTVAIGDYNNDIPMFETAKIGIAVSNASEDALAAADYVTVSNEEDAVARVICDLEGGKYTL